MKASRTLSRRYSQVTNPWRPDTVVRSVLLGSVNERFSAAYQAFMSQNQDWVWHPGSVSPERVLEIMQQSGIVVLPSRTETFGRVLVEAQLCGCAVIGMRVGGMPEIVEDGITGLLVQPDDSQALARAIGRLCESSELRSTLAAAGRARSQETYGMDSVMENLSSTYKAIIQGMPLGFTPRTA